MHPKHDIVGHGVNDFGVFGPLGLAPENGGIDLLGHLKNPCKGLFGLHPYFHSVEYISHKVGVVRRGSTEKVENPLLHSSDERVLWVRIEWKWIWLLHS